MTDHMALALVAEGRITLQIPSINVRIEGGRAVAEADDPGEAMPRDCYCFLRGARDPAVGRQGGYTFFTRKGYERYKPQMRALFEAAQSQFGWRSEGRGWAAFEEHAESHFKGVEQRRAKLIADLKAKIADLEAFEV